MFRVYLVAHRSACSGDLLDAVAAALSGLPEGAAAVQLREKDLPARALFDLARALLPLCRQRRVPLLINDRADVALATFADGVQLPARGLPAADARALLGPGAIIGASCHDLDELRAAERGAATFAVFSPIWAVPGKGEPLGLDALAQAARATSLPLFALGGVDATNAAAAMRAGASGVACRRSVLSAPDPRQAAKQLWAALEAA